MHHIEMEYDILGRNFDLSNSVRLKKERSIFIPHSLDRNVRHAARVANTFARGNSTRCCGHDGRVTRGQ